MRAEGLKARLPSHAGKAAHAGAWFGRALQNVVDLNGYVVVYDT